MNNKLVLFVILVISFLSRTQIVAQPKKDSVMILENGSYEVSGKNVKIIINPSEGGRITSFKLNDYEFLTGRDINPDNFGSTFWPAPQTIWNWPPPPALDNEAYAAVNKGNSIKLTSGIDPITGFQFVKVFSGNKNNNITLNYSIINRTNQTKKAAPWEISRVKKGGLLFFPIEENSLGIKSFEPADVDIINGIAWYKDNLRRPGNNQLSTADGREGWAAYAINGKLFVKKFKDVKQGMIAPGEGEVTLYIASKEDYIEFEIEGEYKILKPGEKLLWNVEWIGRYIPANLKVEKGSDELIEFVSKVINKP
jgi:Domain of unknown function (DUF4380)